MNTSEMMRELVKNGYERHPFSKALDEIKAAINGMAAQKGGPGSSEDLIEIRRIVTQLDKRSAEHLRISTLHARSSPYVSRQLDQK